MSGVQMPKRCSYVLPSVESFHILRAPSSSIHTRKKERIDMSDVTWMIRNDDSRINEGISYLQKGVNPMIDVSYNTNGMGGSRLTTMSNSVQGSIPYKVMRNGSFRPPIFTQEDLLPLSRQRRSETAAITNPGIRSGFSIHNLQSQIDVGAVNAAIDKEKINYISARPTAVYRMEIPQEVFSGHRLKDPLKVSASAGYMGNQNYDIARVAPQNSPMEASRDRLDVSAAPNVNNPNANTTRDDSIDINNYIKDNIILKNISPNFRIMVFDSNNKNYSEVFSSIKEKLNIAVQSSLNNPISLARSDGTQIKIKDYRWQIVTSAVGGDNLVLLPQNAPDLQLERNTPLYAVGTNTSGYTKQERFHTIDPLMGSQVQASAGSGVSMRYGRQEAIHDVERNMNLRGMGTVGGHSNMGSMPIQQNHDIPTLSSKNISVKQAAAQEMGSRYNQY
ncbi:MAG: hypothetical protein PHG66_00270 [Candidatus Colwellbacteria bacterium]|nr:hypothetical protein [Candidatus Colwellbacteria bacterium]